MEWQGILIDNSQFNCFDDYLLSFKELDHFVQHSGVKTYIPWKYNRAKIYWATLFNRLKHVNKSEPVTSSCQVWLPHTSLYTNVLKDHSFDISSALISFHRIWSAAHWIEFLFFSLFSYCCKFFKPVLIILCLTLVNFSQVTYVHFELPNNIRLVCFRWCRGS